jgi:hypothetical protein
VEHKSSPRHHFDGSDRPDADSLQRHPSRARPTPLVLTPSAPQVADTSTAPWHLQSLVIRGGGGTDVHVSLFAGGGLGSASDVADIGSTVLE